MYLYMQNGVHGGISLMRSVLVLDQHGLCISFSVELGRPEHQDPAYALVHSVM